MSHIFKVLIFIGFDINVGNSFKRGSMMAYLSVEHRTPEQEVLGLIPANAI